MRLNTPANDPTPIITACDVCGGLMRLVGTEPHAVHDGVDLHTYTCTVCEALNVVTVPTVYAAGRH